MTGRKWKKSHLFPFNHVQVYICMRYGALFSFLSEYNTIAFIDFPGIYNARVVYTIRLYYRSATIYISHRVDDFRIIFWEWCLKLVRFYFILLIFFIYLYTLYYNTHTFTCNHDNRIIDPVAKIKRLSDYENIYLKSYKNLILLR